MPLTLGVIADDYTGASDLANTLSKEGVRTVQTIGVPDAALALPDADAVVVSLKSRSIPADEAVAQSLAAYAWLKGRGASHILFKVCSTFDSTDEGNIGPVTDALRLATGAAIVPVTPAFPETGRTVYMGHLFVGDVPLNESPLKDHPLNPMTDSDLKRVLARQSAGRVGLVPLKDVAAGADAVSARLEKLALEGRTAAIVDAVFDRDLEAVGIAAAVLPLSTGASGLGLGLARALIADGRVLRRESDGAALAAGIGGYAGVVAGSCSKATLEQIAVAEGQMPVLRLSAERLVTHPEAEVAAALEWAKARLASGPVLIAASGAPEQVAEVQARFGRHAAGVAVEHGTAAISEGLVAAGVRRLVLAGGETSGASVDRLKIPAFLVGPEIAPGVPLLRTEGQPGEPMVLALKSGNFGGPDFFAKALGMMGVGH
ncbi:3-oxo-tetronate kinase [Xanthobacter aminoxidans]|uniref:3-oxo-tetronate kinase n=1 Tax=Xanthobacter aminoxidans TaxID=186280 RepID=UPI002022C598|nr:3-oxo-tetronate kinase [Xanthobacter aminoxidans]MCL8384494.1 four-carbon acid sugar kinase family protein [Xanthobacter aminoxidans]